MTVTILSTKQPEKEILPKSFRTIFCKILPPCKLTAAKLFIERFEYFERNPADVPAGLFREEKSLRKNNVMYFKSIYYFHCKVIHLFYYSTVYNLSYAINTSR